MEHMASLVLNLVAIHVRQRLHEFSTSLPSPVEAFPGLCLAHQFLWSEVRSVVDQVRQWLVVAVQVGVWMVQRASWWREHHRLGFVLLGHEWVDATCGSRVLRWGVCGRLGGSVVRSS